MLKAPELMAYDSVASGEFASSYARDAAFEQLLRLAASLASPQTAAAQGGPHSGARRSPVTEDIESRAYQIYLGRGGADGHDLDDWLQAERQVLEELKKNKASLRLALAFGRVKDSAER
jgi:Protein of unknown function (DUF2934)